MQGHSWIGVAFVTLALAGCAVTGPQLGYADFLPNTNEDPVWGRNAPPPVAPDPAPAPGQTTPTR